MLIINGYFMRKDRIRIFVIFRKKFEYNYYGKIKENGKRELLLIFSNALIMRIMNEYFAQGF